VAALAAAGAERVMVDAGGDIASGGAGVGREPWVVGIQATSDQRLWVVVLVPSKEWEEKWDARGSRMGFGPEMFDSVIEVIDLDSARVVASQRVPYQVSGFTGNGLLYSYEEDEDNQPRISVFSVSLQPHPNGGGHG
jgi:hypothetical protein